MDQIWTTEAAGRRTMGQQNSGISGLVVSAGLHPRTGALFGCHADDARRGGRPQRYSALSRHRRLRYAFSASGRASGAGSRGPPVPVVAPMEIDRRSLTEGPAGIGGVPTASRAVLTVQRRGILAVRRWPRAAATSCASNPAGARSRVPAGRLPSRWIAGCSARPWRGFAGSSTASAEVAPQGAVRAAEGAGGARPRAPRGASIPLTTRSTPRLRWRCRRWAHPRLRTRCWLA